MISRRRKITTAGIVLALGLAIAWPFRRSGEVQPELQVANGSLEKEPILLLPKPAETPQRMNRLSGPLAVTPFNESKPESLARTIPSGGLPSTLASTLVPMEPAPVATLVPTPLATAPIAKLETFDSPPIGSLPRESIQPFAEGKRPVYSTAMRPVSAAPQRGETESGDAELIEEGETESATRDLRIHVVHNGDTLERLAARYLDDERRALEIFDLNRGTLTNPHLLPIGVEIVIPEKN